MTDRSNMTREELLSEVEKLSEYCSGFANLISNLPDRGDIHWPDRPNGGLKIPQSNWTYRYFQEKANVQKFYDWRQHLHPWVQPGMGLILEDDDEIDLPRSVHITPIINGIICGEVERAPLPVYDDDD